MKETLRFDEAQDPTEKSTFDPAPRKTEPQREESQPKMLVRLMHEILAWRTQQNKDFVAFRAEMCYNKGS